MAVCSLQVLTKWISTDVTQMILKCQSEINVQFSNVFYVKKCLQLNCVHVYSGLNVGLFKMVLDGENLITKIQSSSHLRNT